MRKKVLLGEKFHEERRGRGKQKFTVTVEALSSAKGRFVARVSHWQGCPG